MAESVNGQENIIPAYFYNLNFNYVKFEQRDYATTFNDIYMTTFTWTFFNKRHKSVAVLIQKATPSLRDAEKEPTGENIKTTFSGILHLTPWAWNCDTTVKENRLGLIRPDLFKFIDYALGACKIEFVTHKDTGYYTVINVTTDFYEWDEFGKKKSNRRINRSYKNSNVVDPGQSYFYEDLVYLVRRLSEGRYIKGQAPTYPETSAELEFKSYVLALPIYNVEKTLFTEITANIHDTAQIKIAGNEEVKQTFNVLTDRIFAPIPNIQKVQTLDVGKWSITNLADTPAATSARYNGRIFNNVYTNLNIVNDVGFQQILSAVDSDYVYLWTKVNSANFNDIRSLKDILFSYIPVLATLVCKKLKIRFTYVNYVSAIITQQETLRGLSPVSNQWGARVHGSYPWESDIKRYYVDFILFVFELIKVDLSANDTPKVLMDTYIAEIEPYNRWFYGESTYPDLNVARLGATHSEKITTYLNEFLDFQRRFLCADIDRELTDAYLNDMSFTGDIKINDSAAIVKPGDSVQLNFLDDELIDLKVVGAHIDVTPNMINYNIGVKRQW